MNRNPSIQNQVFGSIAEPWVDMYTVAKHIGFGYQATGKMVRAGRIPCRIIRNGAKTFYRFKLSEVDTAFTQVEADKQAG